MDEKRLVMIESIIAESNESYVVLDDYVLELIEALRAERQKVSNLQNTLSIIMEKESNILHQKGYTLIANLNYPLRYITTEGFVDVKFIDDINEGGGERG